MPVETQRARADARHELRRRRRRRDHDRRRHRQEGQAGLDRREARASAAGSRSGTGRRRTCRRPRCPIARYEPPRSRSSDDAQRQQRVRARGVSRATKATSSATPAASETIVSGVAPAVGLGVREAVDEAEQAGGHRAATPGMSSRGRCGCALVDEQAQRARRRPGSRTGGSRTGTSARTGTR